MTDKKPTDGAVEFEPKTDLAKRIWELRNKALSDGLPLLTPKQIAEKIARRRVQVDCLAEPDPK